MTLFLFIIEGFHPNSFLETRLTIIQIGLTTQFISGIMILGHSFQGSISGFTCSSGPDYGTGSQYIGLRLPSASDTIYAWLRLDLAAFDTTIIHSFNYDTGQKINLTEQKHADFQIYPNPVLNLLHVQLFDKAESDFRINILDCRGTELYSTKLLQESIDIDLDLSSYPVGVYILLVYDGAELIGVERIRKTHHNNG